MNEKMIGGIPVSKWRKAFAEAVNNAFEEDAFTHILCFDLYPEMYEEAAALRDDEKALRALYDAKWAFVEEAFKEVFNMTCEQALKGEY